jgi:hypothetical protein
MEEQFSARSREVMELSDRLRPFLAGRRPEVVSGVLADLLAIWLASHWTETGDASERVREALLRDHLELVGRLTEIHAKRVPLPRRLRGA